MPTGKDPETVREDGSVGPLLAFMLEERWAETRYNISHPKSDTKTFWRTIQPLQTKEDKIKTFLEYFLKQR